MYAVCRSLLPPSKSYVKSWGSVQFFWGGVRSPLPTPQWLRTCTQAPSDSSAAGRGTDGDGHQQLCAAGRPDGHRDHRWKPPCTAIKLGAAAIVVTSAAVGLMWTRVSGATTRRRRRRRHAAAAAAAAAAPSVGCNGPLTTKLITEHRPTCDRRRGSAYIQGGPKQVGTQTHDPS